MTAIDALHGRARVQRARRRCLQVFVAVLLALAVLKLEQLVRINTAEALRGGVRYGLGWLFLYVRFGTLALYLLGYAIGGTLVDAFGVRAVVGLVLVGWCGLVVLGSTMDPAAYGLAASPATSLVPGVVFAASLAALRLTLAPRRRGVAVAALFVAFDYAWSSYDPFNLYRSAFGTLPADDPTAWQYPMFALATVGALILAFWLFAVPDCDPAAGIDLRPAEGRSYVTVLRDVARTAADPLVWGLVGIQFCCTFVISYAADQVWTWELLTSGQMATPVVWTIVVGPIATLVFAGWSDWAFRRTRSFLAARRPFIVIGFLVGGFAPLLATAFERSKLELTIIAALGLAAVRVANLLVVDLAPRRTAGSYIGVVLTGSLAGHAVLNVVLQVTKGELRPWLPAVTWAVAIAGAILAAILLPRMRLPDDRRQGRDLFAQPFE